MAVASAVRKLRVGLAGYHAVASCWLTVASGAVEFVGDRALHADGKVAAGGADTSRCTPQLAFGPEPCSNPGTHVPA